MRLRWLPAVAVLVFGLAQGALAADAPIKIALIQDKTGPLEAYAKQVVTGFQLGLEYATKGTMTVAGRKLEVIEKDSQTKPDVGRNLLSEAFGDDGADLAVGGSSSAVALAMLPVAQDTRKFSSSSRRWRIRSPATNGTATFSAPDATPRRMRSRMRLPSARRARSSRHWRRTMPSAATASPLSNRRSKARAPSSSMRNTRRPPRPTSPRRCSASSTRSPTRKGRRSSG